ncbi:MAG: hypothetical protein JWL97_4018 [Gemmatimonadales bacterium]|nr:hypothetical protein [Gemmatimonadales bacterium]
MVSAATCRCARKAADRSQAADNFFHHLERAGILVRRRFSQHTPDQVTRVRRHLARPHRDRRPTSLV